jgi:hypothetical protein
MKPVLKNLVPYFLCLITLLLIIFYYHIDKHLNGAIFIFLTLLIPIGIISILICFIKGVLVIIATRSAISLKFIIATLLCLASLCYVFLSPYQLSSERLESEVVIRACYEGTQNQATLKFRNDKSFELHWTGVFFSDTWYIGTWKQIGNVLYLTYDTQKSQRLGETLMLKDGYLHNIDQLSNEKKIPMFYLGYCKHEN